VAEVVTHVPVVPRIVQSEAESDATRETGVAGPAWQTARVRDCQMTLPDYIRPVTTADVDACDL